jgi:hypothetical protein
MIRAAEIRSTVAQIESFNTAANTFRDKYNGLPGDLLSTKAAQFGFKQRAGGAGIGDGNRLVEGGAAGAIVLSGETGLFWDDLSVAGLLGQDLTAYANDGLPTGALPGNFELFLPYAKIGQGHFIVVGSQLGRNYFGIAVPTAIDGGYTLVPTMTPQTAFNIDDKLDDANPGRGVVQAVFVDGAGDPFNITAFDNLRANPPTGPARVDATDALGAGSCASISDAPVRAVYTTFTDEQANRPACQLRIRASF